MTNRLYYGDDLSILREHIADTRTPRLYVRTLSAGDDVQGFVIDKFKRTPTAQ